MEASVEFVDVEETSRDGRQVEEVTPQDRDLDSSLDRHDGVDSQIYTVTSAL